MKLIPFYLLLLNILLCNNLYIDKIIIDGNHAIKNNEIYKSMILKRPSLFIRTEFSNKILEQDLQNIIGLYKMNGYLDIEIKTNTYKQKNNYLNITYMVNEGRQYYFNDLNSQTECDQSPKAKSTLFKALPISLACSIDMFI